MNLTTEVYEPQRELKHGDGQDVSCGYCCNKAQPLVLPENIRIQVFFRLNT